MDFASTIAIDIHDSTIGEVMISREYNYHHRKYCFQSRYL